MTVLSFVAQQLLQSRLHYHHHQQQQQLYGALLAAAAAAAAQRAMMVRRQETTATTTSVAPSSPSAPVPHDGPRAKKTASIWSPATDIENNNNNNRTGYNDNSGDDETIAWTSDQTKMRYGHRPTRLPIPSGTGNLNEYRPDAAPAPVLPSGDSL